MAAPARELSEVRLFTPEDLLLLPDGDRYELMDGHLVEVNVGAASNRVTLRATASLLDLEDRGLGIVLPAETGLQIFPGRPNRIPRPDGGFFVSGRLQGETLPDGFVQTPPDLVIEVVSPGDKMEAVLSKIDEYFSAGVRLAWVFVPESRRVLVLQPGTVGRLLGPDDTLDGSGIVPDFSVPVRDLFPPPPKF